MTYVFVVVNLVTGRVIVIVTIKIDKIPEHTQQVFLRKKLRRSVPSKMLNLKIK
jgi:hypothetical protein